MNKITNKGFFHQIAETKVIINARINIIDVINLSLSTIFFNCLLKPIKNEVLVYYIKYKLWVYIKYQKDNK